jgi:hypothetical protein
LLLLAAVAVMIVGVIFGFNMGEKHTANWGVPRPQLIAGIEHEASATALHWLPDRGLTRHAVRLT